jgi:hypothetical protein
MIIRLKFFDYVDEFTLLKFYENPKGTCLESVSAANITPRAVRSEYPGRDKLSFWHIDDEALDKFYGNRVCISSLYTYPGVESVKNIAKLHHISLGIISWMKDDELYDLLKPFI